MNKHAMQAITPIQNNSPVGDDPLFGSIAQAQLRGREHEGTISLVAPGDKSYPLTTEGSAKLDPGITPGHPFMITFEMSDASFTVPPIVLELDDYGNVILTAEGASNGWASEANVFQIGAISPTTTVLFTAPNEEQQEIIIVGTVPTP